MTNDLRASLLQGHAPASLLDTYEQEHRPFAEHRVALSIENGQLAAGIIRAHTTGADPRAPAELLDRYLPAKPRR